AGTCPMLDHLRRLRFPLLSELLRRLRHPFVEELRGPAQVPLHGGRGALRLVASPLQGKIHRSAGLSQPRNPAPPLSRRRRLFPVQLPVQPGPHEWSRRGGCPDRPLLLADRERRRQSPERSPRGQQGLRLPGDDLLWHLHASHARHLYDLRPVPRLRLVGRPDLALLHRLLRPGAGSYGAAGAPLVPLLRIPLPAPQGTAVLLAELPPRGSSQCTSRPASVKKSGSELPQAPVPLPAEPGGPAPAPYLAEPAGGLRGGEAALGPAAPHRYDGSHRPLHLAARPPRPGGQRG